MNRLARLEPWIIASIVLLVAALGVRSGVKAAEERSAFGRWRAQILAMSRGEDISERYNYPNPPIMAVILEPLAHLPPVFGATLWYLLKASMAAMCLYWILNLVQVGGPPFPPWARLLVIGLSLKPILDDLSHGNVNLFILFLCVACIAAYRHRMDLLSGVLLALAVACKVTPALFIPYFLWKRSWKVLAGGVIGCVLFFYPGLVPAARLGMDSNLKQLSSWYTVMVKPFIIEGKVTSEHINQSLPGTLFRLTTHSPSFVTFPEPDRVETPARYDNFLSLDPGTIKATVKACLILFGLLVLLTCRTTERDGWQAGAEYGLIFLGMLLFSERTWKHHAVTLAVPFAVLVYRVAVDPTWWGKVALGVSAGLMMLPALSFSHERETAFVRPDVGKLALVYGAYTWLFLLQVAGLAVLLKRGASSLPWAIPISEAESRPQAA